jgi:hypothetical protein
MSVPSVLIKKSTKSILKYAPYPKLDITPFLEGDIDPDLEWLIIHTPHAEPDYDPRIYLLVTNIPDLSLLDSFTEHPNYPGIRAYQITYLPEKRSKEDILISIDNAEKDANNIIWNEQVHKDKMLFMLSASTKLAAGFQLNEEELISQEEMAVIVAKLAKNRANKNLLVSQIDYNQVPNIDLGWESV